MALKDATIISLDESINELSKTINGLNDSNLKKKLKKKLNKLQTARNKLTPSSSISLFYLFIIPTVLIFTIFGIYYFLTSNKQ